ncbi:WGxxGxxG-CTERM domain-containing protein [Paenibacillus oenotherae]|uniref:WGxxGxxG-CTERM domain-containing protein n=2 Tax=Paenibacillus oenotherae TaxID=1435645 RepID=A0ABS7D0B9_9BACL|nr:WGxxGxxG-CTERM domain-containing protein [Paenibacillus oenotherae]
MYNTPRTDFNADNDYRYSNANYNNANYNNANYRAAAVADNDNNFSWGWLGLLGLIGLAGLRSKDRERT